MKVANVKRWDKRCMRGCVDPRALPTSRYSAGVRVAIDQYKFHIFNLQVFHVSLLLCKLLITDFHLMVNVEL